MITAMNRIYVMPEYAEQFEQRFPDTAAAGGRDARVYLEQVTAPSQSGRPIHCLDAVGIPGRV